MGTGTEETTSFWSSYQPGFRWARSEVGSPAFFEEVESHRYALEPHIPEVVRFERWADRDVLEVGCGIATDGARFARSGARYVGVDPSPTAVELARERFRLERLGGSFEQAGATALPFEASSFDLVFSHGVIHHFPAAGRAVDEFHRVLRPGGTALVMVYHRESLNYRVNIMVLRRALAATLLLPRAPVAWARILGEDRLVLDGHRALLREHGSRYLTDAQLFLSNNTDGPGNPYSRVYGRDELKALFRRGFSSVETCVRNLNLRLFPGGDRLARTSLGRALERRIGWHLYVRAVKQ